MPKRRLGALFLPALLVAAGTTLVSTSPVASAETLPFTPTDDATVLAAKPNANRGTAPRLRADATPRVDLLLEFSLDGLAGREVSDARLRLHVLDASNRGGTVAGTASGWDERSVTWTSSPAAGSPVATLGRVSAGSWYDADVTSLVTSDGLLSLRIATTSSNAVQYAAKESDLALAPRLEVTVADLPPSDTTAPTVPRYLRALSVGPASVGLAWDPSSDATGVTAYDVMRDGAPVGTVAADRPSVLDQVVQPDTTYAYSVRARDGAGNTSAPSADLLVTTPSSGGDPVLVGAGDIATCPGSDDEATAALLDAVPGTVFTAGDNVYPYGTAKDFADCYAPSWGRHRARTQPAVGNHEYMTSGASGYYGYFGAAAGNPATGYYSYDVGSWHVVVLNSNCSRVGGCGAGSAQEQWLRTDLAATRQENIAAFWHHPWRSSGVRGGSAEMTPIWQALYDHGTELAVVGHDHFYERFAALDAFGNLDTTYGIRSFVVGTGGAPMHLANQRAVHSQAFARTFGVLKLTLRENGYDWTFLPTSGGAFTESGTGEVHPAPVADPEAPSPPASLSATPVASRVDLTWPAADDNVGTVGYQLERNGVVLPTLGNVVSYADRDVAPEQSYSYRIRAADAAGNWSGWTAPTTVTTPPPPVTVVVPVGQDAKIAPATPDLNFGAEADWRVDADPVADSLLRLDVSGVNGREVQSARLHLTCVDPSGVGGQFFAATSGAWDEQTVTWSSAPAAEGAILGSLGGVVAGREYVVDLTGHVGGDGSYALRASSPSTDAAEYASSETTGSGAPYLELTLGPAP